MAEIKKIEINAPSILSQKDRYAPLNISYEDIFEQSTRRLGLNIDGLATISLFNNKSKFFVELVSSTAPKIILSKLGLILSYGQQLKENPIFEKAKLTFDIGNQINFLLVVPYITSEIKNLTQNLVDISVLDLCGNYIIKSKNISAVRLDCPNEYRESRSIQNIYKGVSALVGRALLEGRREYESVTSFVEEIGRLGGQVTFSTVSKVLNILESDLIIERRGKKIKLLQADKLLQKTLENFSKPAISNEILLKVENVMAFAQEIFLNQKERQLVFSGESSVQKYAIATQPQIYTIYTNLEVSNQDFKKYIPDSDYKFFNVVIQFVKEPGVYFAPLKDGELSWSGLTQTYLELMTSDKRGKELAEPIKDIILKGAK